MLMPKAAVLSVAAFAPAVLSISMELSATAPLPISAEEMVFDPATVSELLMIAVLMTESP
jgi:hypothetical protein